MYHFSLTGNDQYYKFEMQLFYYKLGKTGKKDTLDNLAEIEDMVDLFVSLEVVPMSNLLDLSIETGFRTIRRLTESVSYFRYLNCIWSNGVHAYERMRNLRVRKWEALSVGPKTAIGN